jgi:hypothetical protein
MDVKTARAVQIYPDGGAKLAVDPSNLIELVLA